MHHGIFGGRCCDMRLSFTLEYVLMIYTLLSFGNVDSVSSWSVKSAFQRWRSSGRIERFILSHSQAQNETFTQCFFMEKALEEAQKAALEGEVPIGAVLVRPAAMQASKSERTFEILARGHNRVESDWDASSHAELQVMREGARNIRNWRLLNTTLYSTLEPCAMCLAACQAFRIDTVVYGAPDLRLGAVETRMNLLEMAPHPFHNISKVVKGVEEETSADLLRDFFRKRRRLSKSKRGTPRMPWRSRVVSHLRQLFLS